MIMNIIYYFLIIFGICFSAFAILGFAAICYGIIIMLIDEWREKKGYHKDE